MKMIGIIFQKKFCLRQMDHCRPKIPHSYNSGSAVRIFFNFRTLKRANMVDESNNNGLYQKKFVEEKWAVLGPKMTHPHNSGYALRIFLKFCRMKGA